MKKYITAYLESYLINKYERFDVKEKNLLSRNYKYYAADPGLRRVYKVHTGKVDDLEVDFVAENRD